VFDTNVLIDAFQDDFSAQAKLLDAVINGEVTAVVTPAVEREYRLILHWLISDPQYEDRINDFLAATKKVTPQRVDTQLDDAEDYKILQAAVGGEADLVVTHDHHLLSVGELEGIRIVRPQEAWAIVQEEGEGGSSEWQDFIRGFGIGR